MIIGFLGKGGSGKSTLSYRTTQALEQQGKHLLAVDADHNMDLTYNLGVKDPFPYLGSAMDDFRKCVGLSIDEDREHYSEVFFKETEPNFQLDPIDPFTKKYTAQISPNIRIMAAGPHTEDILHGKMCSHKLTTPLKIYLPFLQLSEDEYAVVDAVAGADAAGTGIPTGFTCAMVVTEPTEHGIKTANQIADLLEYYDTPYEFILNKIQEEDDVRSAATQLKKPHLFTFRFSSHLVRPSHELDRTSKEEIDRIVEFITSLKTSTRDDRKERSREKFKKNRQIT